MTLALMAAPVWAQGAPALAVRIEAGAGAALGADKTAAVARLTALQNEAAKESSLDAAHRVVAEQALAVALVSADRLGEAQAAIARGLALAQAAGMEKSAPMAALLSIEAELGYASGWAGEALSVAREADSQLVALYGPHSAVRSAHQATLGRILNRLGMQREAREAYLEATREEGMGQAGTRAGEVYVEALVGLAQVLSGLGEEEVSIATYGRAREAARRLVAPDDMAIGMIESELAVHLANELQLGEAVPVARSSVDFFRKTQGAAAFDTGAALKNYGYVLARSGRAEEAGRILSEALAIFKNPAIRVRQLGVQVDTLDLLGSLQRDTGRIAESLASLDLGLSLLEQGKKLPVLATNLLVDKSESLAVAGRWTEGLEAVTAARALQPREVPLHSFFRVRVEMLAALALARLGRGDEAWAKALPVGRAMEERLSDPHLAPRARGGLQGIYRSAFERFVEIALATGHQEEAFRAAQWASLTELSVSAQALAARVAAGDARAQGLARKLQQQQENLAALERERNFATARKAPNAAALGEAAIAAEHELDGVLGELRRVYPHYFELALPRPVSLAQARIGLGADQALLLPVQSSGRLFALIVTTKGLKVCSAPLTRAAMVAAVRTLRERMEAGADSDSAAAWSLGAALFNRETLAALQGLSEVSVLGSGPLMTLPLGMLLTSAPHKDDARGQSYALRRFAFSVLPLLGERAKRASAGSNAFLGVGAPRLGIVSERAIGFDLRGGVKWEKRGGAELMRGGLGDAEALRQMPSLPGAASELTQLARALHAAGSLVLTGKAATEQAVRAQPLAQFGILAFATHGLISGELGALHEPALVLTPPASVQTSENDGLLTASEIAGLKLDADWVILSACNTGSGLDNGAGGYSGLARGFMQAGARNLLVSLWPVRDDVAARISVATVNGYAHGLSRPAALRRAMLDVIADPKVRNGGNPAVWAPFSLVMQQ